MCTSMVDMQSATAEIGRGKNKKEEEKRRKKKQDINIMFASATTQGGHNKWSKNFDENPHRMGIFHWENLM